MSAAHLAPSQSEVTPSSISVTIACQPITAVSPNAREPVSEPTPTASPTRIAFDTTSHAAA